MFTECSVTAWDFDGMFYWLRTRLKTCLQNVVLLAGNSTECFTSWEPVRDVLTECSVTDWEFDLKPVKRMKIYWLGIQSETC